MKAVGFDQKILLHQLDFTAKQVREVPQQEMYQLLDGFIREDVGGSIARKHVITILMKVWSKVENQELRDEMLALLPDLTSEERLFVHWGMVLMAYPFFKDVACELGRLFKLQDVVTIPVLKQRVKESYGDRERVNVAISSVLRSLKNWNVLTSEKTNELVLNEKIHLTNPALQPFAVKVLLKSLDKESATLDSLQNHLLMFPFTYEFDLMELRQHSDLSFHRQGVDGLIVEVNEK